MSDRPDWLTEPSAERSAGGCTVHLIKEPIIEYINSNIVLLKSMIASGYSDVRTIKRRIAAMEACWRTCALVRLAASAAMSASRIRD